MKLYLFNNHDAVAIDDHAETITVVPDKGGVMSIEGQRFEVEGTGSPVPRVEGVGRVFATYTTTDGIRYQILAPRLAAGVPITSAMPMEAYVMVRVHVDKLERTIEDVRAELLAFKGQIKHDALGFMMTETEAETEQTEQNENGGTNQ